MLCDGNDAGVGHDGVRGHFYQLWGEARGGENLYPGTVVGDCYSVSDVAAVLWCAISSFLCFPLPCFVSSPFRRPAAPILHAQALVQLDVARSLQCLHHLALHFLCWGEGECAIRRQPCRQHELPGILPRDREKL